MPILKVIALPGKSEGNEGRSADCSKPHSSCHPFPSWLEVFIIITSFRGVTKVAQDVGGNGPFSRNLSPLLSAKIAQQGRKNATCISPPAARQANEFHIFAPVPILVEKGGGG
jgi:hypothetical protein